MKTAEAAPTTKHLSQIPSGIVRQIATAMIARHGEYTYTIHQTGERVRVIADPK